MSLYDLVGCENFAQIPALLAHEIGHIPPHHPTETREHPPFGFSFFALCRTCELEADDIGMILMARTGYDPIEQIALYQDYMRRGVGFMREEEEISSTHPTVSGT